MSQQSKPDLSQVIAEEFGANATYVEGLLERFRNNPELVDDSWRSYFTELIGGDGNGIKTVAAAATAERRRSAAAAPAPQPKPAAPAPAPQPEGEVIPIRGPAQKIVENMERSLSVPTATSERRIPVKLLDENRRIINKHLAENDRGKASYTHLIAWAVVRALDTFPQLNDGYADSRRHVRARETHQRQPWRRNRSDEERRHAHAPRAQHQERKQSQLL